MADAKRAACTAKLTATASLLQSNLAVSPSGWACSVHNSVSSGGKLLLHGIPSNASRDGPDANLVTSIRYLTLAFGPVLCVTSTSGSQIYSEDVTTLLFFSSVKEAGSGPDVQKHHQGSCVVESQQHVAIGTSSGGLVVVQAAAANQFIDLPTAPPQGAAAEVTDVCWCRSTGMVVSVHSNGDLRMWAPAVQGPYQNTAVVPGVGQSPVRVAPLGPRLLVADGPGTIRLFDAQTCALLAAIVAHARWLTAIDVREESSAILSVGEDTAMNIWQVDPGTGEVALAHSSVVTDKLLTGAAFSGAGVVVTAYDSDELFTMAL